MRSSRNSRFYSGALEYAGLGEAAYFLRKAKQQIAHAQASLDGVDPLGHIVRGNKKIDEVISQIGAALLELEQSEHALIAHAEESEDAENQDKEEKRNVHPHRNTSHG